MVIKRHLYICPTFWVHFRTGRLLLFYYLDNQRNNADDQSAELKQLRVCNHWHPSFPEGKRKTYPPKKMEGLTAYRDPITPYNRDYSIWSCACPHNGHKLKPFGESIPPCGSVDCNWVKAETLLYTAALAVLDSMKEKMDIAKPPQAVIGSAEAFLWLKCKGPFGYQPEMEVPLGNNFKVLHYIRKVFLSY